MYSLKDHYSEIKDKKLKVVFTDGDVVVADFESIHSGFETDHEFSELDLLAKDGTELISCYEDEIETIEVLGTIE